MRAMGSSYDPLANKSQQLMDVILLAREVRVAGIVFNPATYGAANKEQLAGAAQWSDPGSDPLGDLSSALDACIVRPNLLTLGQATWTGLRRHPDIVSAVLGNSGTKGMVSRQQLAELLELEEVAVGQSLVNTAKPGQPKALGRAWGKHAALSHRGRNLVADGGPLTFGFTGQWGTRIAGDWEDKNIGLRGGRMVRTGESVGEVISVPDAGYLFQDAVA
jgi:hypothetical protein